MIGWPPDVAVMVPPMTARCDERVTGNVPRSMAPIAQRREAEDVTVVLLERVRVAVRRPAHPPRSGGVSTHRLFESYRSGGPVGGGRVTSVEGGTSASPAAIRGGSGRASTRARM